MSRGGTRAAALLAGAVFLSLLFAHGHSVRAAGCEGAVTVGRGDTLSGIARRCGSTVDAILQANPRIGDPRQLQLGWRLEVPQGGGSGAGSTARRQPDSRQPDRRPRGGNRDGLTAAGVRPPSRGVQSLAVQPRSGAPGSAVTISLAGLPPGPAELGAGLEGGDRQRLLVVEVPDSGAAQAELSVPDWAVAGDPLVFTVRTGDGVMLSSGSFEVVAPPGDAPREEAFQGAATPGPAAAAGRDALKVAGRLREGADCMLLETPGGYLYALRSDNWTFTPGAAVSLTGRVAERGECTEGRATIEVATLRPAPPPAPPAQEPGGNASGN